jgi:formylmethanofuran dehydrogenase subunit E
VNGGLLFWKTMKQNIFQEKLFVHNKKCSRCHIVKDIEAFGHDAGRSDGYRYWCKECTNNNSKIYYAANRELKARKSREYREKNKEKINAWVKEYRKNNKDILSKRGKKNYQKTKEDKQKYYESKRDVIRNKNIFRNYGITIEQKTQMIIDQNNCCAICGEQLSNSRFTHIDHDHKTNKVRGILCANCNSGIGMFKDNVNKLKRAIVYLERGAADVDKG